MKILCSSLSSSEVNFLMESSHFAFLNPLVGFGATYAVCLRLTGKCVVAVVDFLLVIIELFSLGVTAELLRANID